jgi:alcohol dehydrogenase class IV
LARLLQLQARTYREGVVNLIGAIEKLERNLGVEKSVSSLKIEQDKFKTTMEQMAETALLDRCTPTNPRKPSKEDLIGIYQKIS